MSQTTFNKDIKIMNFITRTSSVLHYNDTIILIGHGTDINPYSTYDAFIAKFDINGNKIERFLDTLGFYFYDYSNESYIHNNSVITAVTAKTRDSTGNPDFVGKYLWKIRISDGKALKKIKFSNPDDEKDAFIYALGGMAQIDSNHYAVVYGISKDTSTVDPQICIVDMETEEVKYIQFGREGISDIAKCIVWTGEKLLVGSGYWYPDYDYQNPYQKIYNHTLIYEVDTTGVVREVYVSDTMRLLALDMMTDEYDNIIFLSGFVHYSYDKRLNRYYPRVHYNITKLDKDYNLLWEKPIGMKHDIIYGHPGNIIHAEEGDGYITAIAETNYPWDVTDEELDSMRATGTEPNVVGVIQKSDLNGNPVWIRSYSVVDDSSLNPDHDINDITYADDGGYIVYGEISYNARPNIDTIYNQNAWLFKVDRYGCLIPDCQEGDTTSVHDEKKDIDNIMLYPNPASDYLYVYTQQSQNTKYQILDLSGRKIKEWIANRKNHTYMVDISGYRPGMYILSKKTKGGKMINKKFVVE